uniref:Uncharacterized protein n=1 Tax=Anguilla anguilla TaxID=7936 RepID=A0A0E9VXC7_ANGAN
MASTPHWSSFTQCSQTKAMPVYSNQNKNKL